MYFEFSCFPIPLNNHINPFDIKNLLSGRVSSQKIWANREKV
jgi:hypothetical protein